MIGPIRNHVSVLIKNEAVFFIVGVLVLNASFEESNKYLLIIVAFMAWLMFISFRAWAKTTFTFTDDGITSFKDTLNKNTKNLPYTKLASVNLVRGVADLIFGTATLKFNANSGVNAARPEMVLCVKLEMANEIKNLVDAHIFETVPEQDTPAEDLPIIRFRLSNVILHGLFSVPTWVTLMSLGFLGYAVVSAFTDGSGTTLALLMFALQQVVPMFAYMFRYYNFAIYRDGDTIHVSHGLISKYSTSFDVDKINAVRVKRPFFARLLHMACLEAEVVGINAMAKDVRPVLCLLMKEEEFGKVFSMLVPEFDNEIETQLQPDNAKAPVYFKAGAAVVTLAVGIAMACWVLSTYGSEVKELEELALRNYTAYAIAVMAVALSVTIYCAVSSISYKAYGCSDDMFVLNVGLLDREVATIYYDRVQMVLYTSGPIARRYGICKCTVSLLTAAGHSTITTGYFRKEDLEKIEEKIFEKLGSAA